MFVLTQNASQRKSQPNMPSPQISHISASFSPKVARRTKSAKPKSLLPIFPCQCLVFGPLRPPFCEKKALIETNASTLGERLLKILETARVAAQSVFLCPCLSKKCGWACYLSEMGDNMLQPLDKHQAGGGGEGLKGFCYGGGRCRAIFFVPGRRQRK
ncbi:hypothetical protein CEXT_22481 [Caerostris extrusa]|uniref:Uncharacterized protein n=1 Tax=Caerostris extrusa TaxID=172846 RepID=A0AAV4P7L9_CAEEX|nr:hypothetical protein CEXT_22481 [Caerostris extrusa]